MSTSDDTKPKKPKDTAVDQQRLASWQPIITAGTILPIFFIIGILFIPVGIGLLLLSESVQEISVEYTYCEEECPSTGCVTNDACADIVLQPGTTSCNCKLVTFTLGKPFQGQVFLYYALTNFHQNHRRYVTSRDDMQLFGNMGSAKSLKEPSVNCIPYQKVGSKIVYPCGAVANSMFSDTITLRYEEGANGSGNWIDVPMTSKGIAWDSDIQDKFKYPSFWQDLLTNKNNIRDKFAKPEAWAKGIWDIPDGVKNEEFIVWMRLSAFPSFRKLYRKIEHNPSGPFADGLPAGRYGFNISYSYPVKSFKGTKSLVLATTSILGTKNPFLGIAYIGMGGICFILGLLFLVIHMNYSAKRTLIEKRILIQSTSPPSTATNSVAASVPSSRILT